MQILKNIRIIQLKKLQMFLNSDSINL